MNEKPKNTNSVLKYFIGIIAFIGFFAIIAKIFGNENSNGKYNESYYDSLIVESDSIITDYKPIKKNPVDPTKTAKLASFFTSKSDDFNDYKWIKPKVKPAYINNNGFYCYFAQNKDGSVGNFRFVGQYASEDWLFVKSLTFNIDGENINFYPDNVSADNDTSIWEWYDQEVTGSTVDLVRKIAGAKKVKVRFHGNQYYDDKVMSPKYISSIKNTLEYYEALGGGF